MFALVEKRDGFLFPLLPLGPAQQHEESNRRERVFEQIALSINEKNLTQSVLSKAFAGEL